MFTLRCTQKLLRSGARETADPVGPATTVLGDWYANILFCRPQRLLVCVSDVSLLPIVLPASPAATLARGLPQGLAELLLQIGIPRQTVQNELEQMQACAVGRTASRRILGTLNGYRAMLEQMVKFNPERPDSTLGLSLWLAETPSLTLPGTFPVDVTRARLGSGSN